MRPIRSDPNSLSIDKKAANSGRIGPACNNNPAGPLLRALDHLVLWPLMPTGKKERKKMIPINKNFSPRIFTFILAILVPGSLLAEAKDPVSLQADFSKTALPILQQSCFACHGPKPQSTDGIQDPDLKKKANKVIAKAQKEFNMAETFPFPQSDEPKDDLKDISKSIQKGWMPPKSQKALNLGQPLGPKDKKALVDWTARALKALSQ
jgi:hypothetical protein